MQKQKRYALRKIAGYGLVSCAVGVMLIGGIPTFDSYDNHVFATESTIQSESPYVSQQAINQVNERSAFTSNQVVMEETAQNLDQDRQTGVGYILKALDSLPESIRKFVTGLSFYQKSDGYYGLTQSLAGSTRLNTQYYNLQNFDQSLGTLYHEISHSIDGKTYTNNGTEYSLSRDEKVVPLLKAIAPNAPVFETWSNLFAKYVMTRVNQDVARSENENKAMKYFDDLFGEALFGSKAYNQEGVLSVQQDGVSVAIVNEGIQIKIDDGKKFRKGERLLLTVNMPQRNIDAIIPRGDIRIQGVTVGNVKLEYPNLGKTPREVALTAFYEKMRAKELNVWTKADLDEYFEIQKLSDNVWGYVVLSFDSEKINDLSNRTILLKSTELHKDQNVLENRMVYEKRLDLSDKGTNGTRINHKLIKEFANTHSDKWRLNLDDYMGVYDQLMPKTLDNEIIGTLNFNNETVKEFHLRPALWFDQIHDDATGKVTDNLVPFINYDYDTFERDVNISKNSSFANYSELLKTNVLEVKIPSSMTVVANGWKSEKERIFKPGDMKQEFFLNSEKSGLTVKPELIGTTQHYVMDKVNDYTTVADVIWSDDHSWGSFKPSEVIKGITTHYEWDVVYEKDKITIVNTNEVHMPKYALMEFLGPQLSIGKELMFDENVIFNDVDNWKYGDYYYMKGYATSAISGYHHTYYHDSLNNEKKEFTSKPEPYILLLDLKSIEGSGNQLPHNVVVQYVEQTGKEIQLSKTIKENANYADSYKYEPETIEGYQFMGITEDSAPLKGLVGYTDKVIKVKYFDLSQPTTSEETQTKEITRTIQVTTPDGQTQEEIQKVTYRHTKVTNLITGEVTDKGWSSEHPRFDSYQVPVINGYTATHESIPEMQVENPDMENQIIHVTYSANPQENKVFLWDTELNQSVGEMTINGVTGAEKAYDLTTIYEGVKDKYDVDTNSLTGKYIFLAENNVPIKIPITHKLQKEKETKQATRTIIVHKPDGSSDEVAQNVTFTRTKTTDLATHSVSYTDWESDHPNYDEYVVPNIDGYKPSQEKI
ncbi:mucin-binding protein [Enterococcus cecorum]|uniref:MucBP domain-containing protein n=1 Tax=Enterococcus cecorum TaxID=44008 RepID=A0A7X9RL24_9ENTE|nr:MucBP domain-containing protein [Enterococcus cecorum]NME48959.1 MucBP domain-containing protein [Enterococcus cecorum]